MRATRLDNGLKVLIQEEHTAPLASVWCWYKVGSKDERPGLTGVSHWCEHMNFKGTENIPRDEMKGIVERFGGTWNGYTWLDQTTYLETAGTDALDTLLFIEAERMARRAVDDTLDRAGPDAFEGRVARDVAAGLPAGARFAVAGLHSGPAGTHLHVVARGLRALPQRVQPGLEGDAGFSWWLRDDAGGWHLGAIDETAREIGAVNTIDNRDGYLTGYNTDCAGAVRALEEVTSLQGRRIALLGAGGAARAIAWGVQRAGARFLRARFLLDFSLFLGVFCRLLPVRIAR